jgi:glycosyltransferase involved in cell wall biosynthesis
VRSLSIVTINRNNSIGLEKTLTSIFEQSYAAIELIIIDGASTDGSVNVINEKMSNIDSCIQVSAISEQDSGIYNAMNKGLANATGDYIFFLNSGDTLVNNRVVENVFSLIDAEDVVYGNICLNIAGRLKIVKSNPEINFFERYQHDVPPQPATFIKTEKIRQIGGFDESYRIVSDVALIMKLFSNKNLKYRFVDMPITIFDLNGVSSKSENEVLVRNERRHLILSNYPSYIDDFENIYRQNESIFIRKFKDLFSCLF